MLNQRKIVLEPAERGKDNNGDRGDSEVTVGGRCTEVLASTEILDALIGLVDPARWQQYCLLLAEVQAVWPLPTPFAPEGPGLQYSDTTDYGRARLLSLHGTPWHRGRVTMWDGEARRFAADRITEIQALDHTILAEIRAGLAAGRAQVTIWQGVDRVAAPAEWFQHAATNFRFDVAGGRIIGPDGSGYAIAAIDPVNAAKSPTPTGLPGRPSKGRDLIEYEFKRRCGTGEAKAALDEEAEALRGWYIMSYPQAQHPTVKTIKNNIRADHRRWVAGQRQSGGA